ncbi:MAG: DUF3592 domain-containing protein [Lentisphaeria bacterium]|nr:DUF3592 domain-containing protein [Lentisphaeria bacterium]
MKKQFWLGSLNTAILIGFILLIVSCIAYFMKNEISVAIFFGILTILSVAATINFAIADEKGITFYSFLFIPHRFRYDEIFTINYLSHSGKPQFSLLIFHLKSGERKQVRLGLYQLKKQEEIRQFLTSKITLNEEYYRDRERLKYWLNKARYRNMLDKCIVGSVLIFAGFVFQIQKMSWDYKIRNWIKTDAVIELNHTEETKLSEQETIKVYKLRYRYEINGKRYTGHKIAGGIEKLPSGIIPGEEMTCIVNPKDHDDSAIIPRIRTDWITYVFGFPLFFMGGIIIITALLTSLKKVKIPESLKDYVIQFEPQKILELTQQLKGECKISVGKLNGAYREINDRYGCFPLKHSWTADIVILILFVLTIIGGRYVMPHFFLLSLLLLVLFYQNFMPRGVIFDRQEKKIYWSRYFSLKSIPSKIKKKDVLNESDLIALGLTIRKDNQLVLAGIRKDGVYIPVVRADLKRMEQLYSDTVIIAEKLGNLPVIII